MKNKLFNPFVIPVYFFDRINLDRKLDIPEIKVDLVEDDFTPTPINFEDYKDCTPNRVGELLEDFNKISEKINKQN